jgi:hypothetical protein
LILFFVAFIFYTAKVFDRYQEFALRKEIQPGRTYLQSDDFSTIVLGEEDESGALVEIPEEDQVLGSERYKAKLVTFGGNTALPVDDNKKLAISDVRSELLTTRNQEEIKLYISWKTTKPAVSDLVYGKSIEQGGRTVKEEDYGYSHSAILSALDASSAYTYLIKGRDRWGNEVQSDRFAFYTGAPNVSLLDLLLGAFKDVFGWAMKK